MEDDEEADTVDEVEIKEGRQHGEIVGSAVREEVDDRRRRRTTAIAAIEATAISFEDIAIVDGCFRQYACMYVCAVLIPTLEKQYAIANERYV